MRMSNHLFDGKASPYGGLSNEKQLVAECPEEFMRHWTTNKWCDLASTIFFKGINVSNWKYKIQGLEEQHTQFEKLISLLRGWGLKHEHKMAVAGWMLSEMLVEIPNPILTPKKD